MNQKHRQFTVVPAFLVRHMTLSIKLLQEHISGILFLTENIAQYCPRELFSVIGFCTGSIQLLADDIAGITRKIPIKNLPDNFCFIRHDFKLSVNNSITVADAVFRLSAFISFPDTPFAIFGN